MLYRTIVSAADRDCLVSAIEKLVRSRKSFMPHLDLFRASLRRARVLPGSQVPQDLITMNSCFVVRDRRTGKLSRHTLTYPQDVASSWDDALSVVTPMGMALLGAAVGDDVCWMSSAGPEVATVESLIYQPEALGHYRRDSMLAEANSDPPRGRVAPLPRPRSTTREYRAAAFAGTRS